MLGIWRPFALQRDYRTLLGTFGQSGPLLLGAAFGFGWSPCIGPILGSILTLAAASQSLGTGVALLAAYSVGLAPFPSCSWPCSGSDSIPVRSRSTPTCWNAPVACF